MEKENLIVIDFTKSEAIKELEELLEYLKTQEYVAYDTETTGLDRDSEVIGYSVSSEVDLGFYVILSYWDVENKKLIYCDELFKSKALEVLQLLKSKQLIMHNAIFDIEKTINDFNINYLKALHTDTMILAHLLNENESTKLKDLAAGIFGEDEKKEQEELKSSVLANGGIWQEGKKKAIKEMFKADRNILGRYGAKDTILTLKLFYHFVPILLEEGLDKFFWEEESMPLLKGPTYELNTVGMKVDVDKLKKLEKELTDETIRLKAEILKDINHYISEKYPGTNNKNSFNINSSQQLSWLLFIKIGEEFRKLTKGGRPIAKELLGKLPYTSAQKNRFIKVCEENGIKPYKYLQCDKATLSKLSDKYDWVRKLLEYKSIEKLLNTYVIGIQEKVRYGIINPSFHQSGTVGTRYSSSNPNFQNLPRDDKRIKSCIISRPGKSFVGADYSQLEPRVFTALSQDPILIAAYAKGEDFYSVLAIAIFGKHECSAMKDAPNYLGKMYPHLRQVGKEAALSLAYGTTPYKLSETLMIKAKLDISPEECDIIRKDYFERLVGVAKFVRDSHLFAAEHGKVFNLFGRPRRIPEAKALKNLLKNDIDVTELEYNDRTILNSAVNSPIQGTAGSIVNRACIAKNKFDELGISNVDLVLQVHDELVVECLDKDIEKVAKVLKDIMENTNKLPSVALVAEPKVGKNLAELK